MVMTVQKLDLFKNRTMVEAAYHDFLTQHERQEFNLKERRLYKKYNSNISQLNLGYLLTKKGTEGNNDKIAGQNKIIAVALMDILYRDADFYKKVKERREDLPEELYAAIEKSVNEEHAPQINEPEDIAWLKLDDPELQDVLFHMLKGTVSRKEYRQMIKDSHYDQKKLYVSLLNYINKNKTSTIKMAHVPLELLKAVFQNEKDALDFMKKRAEIDPKDSAAADALKAEFINKRRVGLEDSLLDFTIARSTRKLSNYD